MNIRTKYDYLIISFVISLSLLLSLTSVSNANAVLPQQTNEQKIVTTDWTIAETLLAIDAPLVGLGDKKQYAIWVKDPIVGEQVIDLGSRAQPNLEALLNLKPDQMINATWLKNILPPSMSNLGINSASIDFYTAQGLQWDHLTNTTLKLGQLVGKQLQAQQLITQTQQQLDDDRSLLAEYQNRHYAVVQFIDSRHLRIYGDNSLYGLVLSKLNLSNAWQKPTNGWGFNQITLLDLAQLPSDTLLIVVKPHPANVAQKLQHNTLWQALPFSHSEQHRVLPAVWAFGALPSIKRFSQRLTESIIQSPTNNW